IAGIAAATVVIVIIVAIRRLVGALETAIAIALHRRTSAIAAHIHAVASAMSVAAPARPDLGHMLPITAHGAAPALTGVAGFGAIEFMRVAALMGGATALAGDLSLLVLIHRSKAAIPSATAMAGTAGTCHGNTPSSR